SHRPPTTPPWRGRRQSRAAAATAVRPADSRRHAVTAGRTPPGPLGSAAMIPRFSGVARATCAALVVTALGLPAVPVAAEPIVPPGAAQPGTAQPGTAQPDTARPGAVQPDPGQPVTSTTPPFTTPDTATCPQKNLPPPPVDSSE